MFKVQKELQSYEQQLLQNSLLTKSKQEEPIVITDMSSQQLELNKLKRFKQESKGKVEGIEQTNSSSNSYTRNKKRINLSPISRNNN